MGGGVSLDQTISRFLCKFAPQSDIRMTPFDKERVNCCILGCNNGIGGFHQNIVTFERPKLPDFLWAQKMRPDKFSS